MGSTFGGAQTVPTTQFTNQAANQSTQQQLAGAQTVTQAANPLAQQTGSWLGGWNQALGSGYNPFGGLYPTLQVAPLQAEQLGAIGGLEASGMAGYGPALSGLGALNAAAQGDVSRFYNPMAANVTAQMQNIFGQQNLADRINSAGTVGGVGSDRAAVAAGLLANQQGLAAGQTYANLYQQAQQNALASGQTAAQAGFGGLGTALQAATIPQQQQQAVYQALYQQALGGYQDPFLRTQAIAGTLPALTGLGGTRTGATTADQTGTLALTQAGTGAAATTYPAPSLTSQLAGLGTLGLGIAGIGGLFGARGGSVKPKGIYPRFQQAGPVGYDETGLGSTDSEPDTSSDTTAPQPGKGLFSGKNLDKSLKYINMLQKGASQVGGSQTNLRGPSVQFPQVNPQMPAFQAPQFGSFQYGGAIASDESLNLGEQGQQSPFYSPADISKRQQILKALGQVRYPGQVTYPRSVGYQQEGGRVQRLAGDVVPLPIVPREGTRSATPQESIAGREQRVPILLPAGNAYDFAALMQRHGLPTTGIYPRRQEGGPVFEALQNAARRRRQAMGVTGYADGGDTTDDGGDDQADTFADRFGTWARTPDQGSMPLALPRPRPQGAPFLSSPQVETSTDPYAEQRPFETRRLGPPTRPMGGGMAQSPYLALMQAGLGMLAASGQRDARGLPMSPLGAIGTGGMMGVQTLQEQQAMAMRERAQRDLERHRLELENASWARVNRPIKMRDPNTLEEYLVDQQGNRIGSPVSTSENVTEQQITEAEKQQEGVPKSTAMTFEPGGDRPTVDPPAPKMAGGMSPAGIQFAAESLLQTGRVPAGLGRNRVALAATTSYAAELAKSRGLTLRQAIEMQRFNVRQAGWIMGVDGRQAGSMGTVIDHLDTLRDLTMALKNKDNQTYNLIKNKIAKWTGSEYPTNVEMGAPIVGAEILKAIGVTGGATGQERVDTGLHLGDLSKSPQQFLGAINVAQRLAAGQLNTKYRQAEAIGLPKERLEALVGKRAAEILNSLRSSGSAEFEPKEQKEKSKTSPSERYKELIDSGKSKSEAFSIMESEGY